MSDIRTGGPAFPIDAYITQGYMQAEGMTMRDYFAGQAAHAAAAHAFANIPKAQAMQLLPEEWAARIAYGVADAMLAFKEATDPKRDPNEDLPF